MADFLTEDEGNRTCKNLTKNNDIINKNLKFMTRSMNTQPDFSLDKPNFKITSTPFESNTTKTIGVKQTNTDLLKDGNKNLKDEDKNLSGFYL